MGIGWRVNHFLVVGVASLHLLTSRMEYGLRSGEWVMGIMR